jgi:hypothetical protein
MRKISRLLALASLTALAVSAPGCVSPIRVCTGCTFKMVTFTEMPTGSVDTATLTAKVKHVGACPQSRFPDNCNESLSYNVKCAVGSGAVVTLPMLIDAADDNPNRSAKVVVKLVGGSPVTKTGVVATGAGTTTLPATPCPPPTVDPYSTLPQIP